MTAQPVTTGRSETPRHEHDWWQPKPPFTVDTLYDLPESDLRYEVLEGQLVVSPTPTFAHNLAADRIGRLLMPVLPTHVDAVTAMAVRMPNGDGPVPDLVVTSADPLTTPRGIPADLAHTVVEIVSPSNATHDRVTKSALYASGGIACYWRVELHGWKDYLGPVPVIVVQLNADREAREQMFAAGQTHRIPLAVGPGPQMLTVPLDPAMLVGPRR